MINKLPKGTEISNSRYFSKFNLCMIRPPNPINPYQYTILYIVHPSVCHTTNIERFPLYFTLSLSLYIIIFNLNHISLIISLFLKGCQWSEQPSLSVPVQTRPAKPAVQQASVFPVHAAGDRHIVPALLYSLWSLLCHGERRRLPLFWPTNVCRHHSNILGHCRKCSGETINGTKQAKIALMIWKIMLYSHLWCMYLFLDWTWQTLLDSCQSPLHMGQPDSVFCHIICNAK